MSATLRFESFSHSNIRELTELMVKPEAEATALTVASTEGFTADQIIYVGELGREGCERAVVDAVDGSDGLTLGSALQNAHRAYEAVTAVLGDRIRIYRAVNVDGSRPASGSFTVLATRSINPDHPTTYYTDSSGGSDYWYTHTYFNETTTDETPLDTTAAFRGDDHNAYASLSDIRREAGFLNAHNLPDATVDEQRRAAQSEINTALSEAYTVPFSPVPEIVRTLTIRLAAGLLLLQAYGSDDARGKAMLQAAREQLASLRLGDTELPGDEAESLRAGDVSSYPTNDDDRLFRIEDIY